ncbi:hypothetical protein EAG_06501 [Camponotus floridanus]|uniref:Uncharacterized protein n=1 Tax=Camponotus floridanus TaxID=104421 RepID=E1ZYG0_CAMFO|nr:hypothetical protein EAG_06501 [Camponotus floridanus]
MFHLDGRRNTTAAAKYDSSSSEEEESFGWWLNPEIAVLQYGKDHRSSGPMSCYVDSDDSADNRSFVQDVARQEQESGSSSEKIELGSFTRDDLDPDLEKDVEEMNSWSMIEDDNQDNLREEFKAICYTPERLIRSQEYRILVPSPRPFIFSQARIRSENESRERKFHRCQKQSDRYIDSGQIGTMLLSLPITDVRTHAISSSTFENGRWVNKDFNASVRSDDNHSADRDRSARSTGTISSSRSSYDRLNSIGDNYKDLISRPLSLEDTSGIQSNDWSLETQSDARSTPMCLCDELAIASRNSIVSFGNDRDVTINEITAILENLQSDPEKARLLLEEEDSFCDDTSSHDRLTRLALTIETDTEVPSTVSDSNNWIHHLRDKIERLQLGNKEIHRDMYGLRTNFECDEKKAVDLSNDATKLIEDIYELRYFDDLLKLLEGELERISQRNWPFVLGHNRPREEMNLII